VKQQLVFKKQLLLKQAARIKVADGTGKATKRTKSSSSYSESINETVSVDSRN
jgi:hypothetical protein